MKYKKNEKLIMIRIIFYTTFLPNKAF